MKERRMILELEMSIKGLKAKSEHNFSVFQRLTFSSRRFPRPKRSTRSCLLQIKLNWLSQKKKYDVNVKWSKKSTAKTADDLRWSLVSHHMIHHLVAYFGGCNDSIRMEVKKKVYIEQNSHHLKVFLIHLRDYLPNISKWMSIITQTLVFCCVTHICKKE